MRMIFSLAAILLATGLILSHSGCNRPTAAYTSESAKTAAAIAVTRVTAAHPERKTLELYTSQPGRIEAFEETPLYPKLPGYVQDVLVDIGDLVAADQVLVRLWVPEMHDEVERMEALLAQADAEVKQAEAGVQAAQAAVNTALAKIALAEAGIGRAEGEYERWSAEHRRIQELAVSGSVTQKLADETLNQLRAAEAASREAAAYVESAKAAWKEAEAHAEKAQADHLTAEARRRVAQANLARTKTMLGYAEIKAPFDGVVTRRSVDRGHYVYPANSGTTRPLLVVARTDKVRIFVDIPEMEAPLVDTDEHANSAIVRVQALGGSEFGGDVTRTSWSLDSANRSLRTEIDILNPGGLLRPGMYATVTILLKQRSDAIVLPITAVITEGRETYCCYVDSGKIERVPVTLGLRCGAEVEVLSGLDGSQLVVLAHADSLQPGQDVEVIAADG